MKKSHRFLSASPKINGEMISSSYAGLRDRFIVITLEIKSLNTLLIEARDNVDEINFPEDLVKRVRQYKEQGDELTFAMIENALALDKLNQAVIYDAHKKS